MSFYSTTYLNNIKICLNRAIAIQAVESSSRAAYLTEKCQDCTGMVPEYCDLNAWLAVVNGWNNDSVDSNVITEAAFKLVINDISISLKCAQPNPAPSVVVTASGTSITPGATVTFTAAVTGGTTPFGYQWQKNNVNISGATNSTYVITNASSSDTGAYKVIVTDFNQITVPGNAVNITVGAALSITTQPASQTISSGNNVTFSVAATGGTTPYTYQWKKNGTNISGATAINYTITGVTSPNEGNYSVEVTDASNNKVTSSNAVLTVGAVLQNVYVGAKPIGDGTLPNSSTILLGIHSTQNAAGDVIADWTSFLAAPKYLWVAIEASSAAAQKNRWQDNKTSINNGIIATGDDLFSAMTIVNVSGTDYYVTITNYATQVGDSESTFTLKKV